MRDTGGTPTAIAVCVKQLTMAPNFEQALARYLTDLNGQSAAHFAEKHPTLKAYSYEINSTGRRYVRIVKVVGGQHPAHSFVDMTNGNVFSPASWKGPDTSLVVGNLYTYTSISEVHRLY